MEGAEGLLVVGAEEMVVVVMVSLASGGHLVVVHLKALELLGGAQVEVVGEEAARSEPCRHCRRCLVVWVMIHFKRVSGGAWK